MTRQLLLSGLFVVGVLSGSPSAGTAASFSTRVSSTSNQFTAGSLHISQSLAAGAVLAMDNLLAGDSFDAQLDIINSGSLSLRYAMTTTLTGSAALGTALQLTIRTKKTTPCTSRDGDPLFTGSLTGAGLGNPAHGADPGDRTLAAAAGESLCFAVALPTLAAASLQATSAAATFVFVAEQLG